MVKRVLLLSLFLLCLGSVCAGVWLLGQHRKAIVEAPKDLAGKPVRIEVEDSPPPAVEKKMKIAPTGKRFLVSQVGLDVPLDAMNLVDGRISPPGFQKAYLVRNLSGRLDAAAKGTIYVVTHSVRAGNAPGNALIDVASQTVALRPGALIEVGGVHYKMKSWQKYSKQTIGAAKEVWQRPPGSLVIITCLQRTQGKSVENVVIFAQLVR